MFLRSFYHGKNMNMSTYNILNGVFAPNIHVFQGVNIHVVMFMRFMVDFGEVYVMYTCRNTRRVVG